MKYTILLTGATGTIGRKLSETLRVDGYVVRALTTRKVARDGVGDVYHWDPANGYVPETVLAGVDIVIHLAGANVGKKRWTDKYKKEIKDSRIKSADLLFNLAKKTGHIPTQFISISGIGYYEDPWALPLNEESPNGTHFLSEVCREWEDAATQFETLGTRVCIFRTGPVLSANDGLLKAYMAAAPIRMIPTTGSAMNMLSWIHLEDLLGVLLQAVKTSMNGTFNAVAPNPCSQRELVRALATALNKRCIFPNVPSFVLKMALGERAALALTSQIVEDDKLLHTGFQFQYPTVESALKNLVNHG